MILGFKVLGVVRLKWKICPGIGKKIDGLQSI